MVKTDGKVCSKCGGEIRDCICFGIELESCQNCGGFFLNSKIIQKIPVLAKSDAEDVGERKDRSALDRMTMICPKCQCSMTQRTHKRRKAIVLDVCPSCHGIWFDAGEYAKYCGVKTREKAEKQSAHKVYLYCRTCDAILSKPKKEQNVCVQCGDPLTLMLTAGVRPFWYRNHFCAAVFFVVGMSVIYFVALKLLGDIFQASILALVAGTVCLIYIIRALIYNKFFFTLWGRGYEIDLEKPHSYDRLP